MEIIFATGNKNKLREIRAILAGTDAQILSMAEAGFEGDIEEDGTSFEENALIKARTIAKQTGRLTLADDSGLVIDCLNGEPGIYSARYLGEDTPHSEKNKDLIRRLDGVPDEKRSARFVCAVAADFPDGRGITPLGGIRHDIVVNLLLLCAEFPHTASSVSGSLESVYHKPTYQQVLE